LSVVALYVTAEEERLWALVKSGNDRPPLLSRGEAEAAMALLRLLSFGDGEGAEVAYHLAEVLEHRLLADGEVSVSLEELDRRSFSYG
jgi:hypothetical protein